MVLGRLPVPGRPTNLDYRRARPTVLAVGAGGGGFGHFFSRLFFLCSFSFSLGDGPTQTEILPERAVKPKTTNQPSKALCLLFRNGFMHKGQTDRLICASYSRPLYETFKALGCTLYQRPVLFF